MQSIVGDTEWHSALSLPLRNGQFSRSTYYEKHKIYKTVKNMKSVTREVQIKCWGDSKEKENSHLWRNRNHIHNMGPISSTSILCRGKAFKVTFRSSFLIVLFPRTFIYLLTASVPPVMEWIRWHVLLWRAYLFSPQSRITTEALHWKQGCVITFLQLLTLSLFFAASNLILLTWGHSYPAAELGIRLKVK